MVGGHFQPQNMKQMTNLEKFDALLRKLGVRKTGRPCQKSKPRYKTKGIRTKIGISDYWALLFEANELLPASRKLTDADILHYVQLEYPKHMPAINATLASVRQKRSRYNNGRLTGETKPKPETKSRSYNSHADESDRSNNKTFQVSRNSNL